MTHLDNKLKYSLDDVSDQHVLFGFVGSELTKAGEKLGLQTAYGVFVNRTYQAGGTLTSCTEKKCFDYK